MAASDEDFLPRINVPNLPPTSPVLPVSSGYSTLDGNSDGSQGTSTLANAKPSVILSRVIVACERLDLELRAFPDSVDHDSSKGRESARLEALRQAVRGVRTAQQECLHLQQKAEAKVGQLHGQIAELKMTDAKRRQEVQRLRWALANDYVGDLAEDVIKAFASSRNLHVDKNMAKQQKAHLREIKAFERQLAEATALNDNMFKRLSAERAESETKIKKLTLELEQSKKEASDKIYELEHELRAWKVDTKLDTKRRQSRYGSNLLSAPAAAPASNNPASQEPQDERIPPGGSVGANGAIMDAGGNPVLSSDGRPLIVYSYTQAGMTKRYHAPKGAQQPQFLSSTSDSHYYVVNDLNIPPGGSVGKGGVILDANGNPVLGADGKPLMARDSRIPPGGSVGEGGIILDANGNPVLGADGKPIIAGSEVTGGSRARIPPGGSVGKGGVILDASGKPVLGADGKPLVVSDARIPPGGSIGDGGVILDANGNPVLGADGKPLVAAAGSTGSYDPRIPPGGSVGKGGVILDASGKPVLGADGKPLVVSDARIPPGGSIGDGGVILDANGNPVLGADGKPLVAAAGSAGSYDPRIPPGGSVGKGGVILDASGKPVLGADGKPLVVSDARIPPGGSIGDGGVILDANGNPVLGADGKPLVAAAGSAGSYDPRIPPGGSVGKGGVILDASGKPVLGADGKPLVVSDARIPPGGSIGDGGVILDANGNPVLGADGKPLVAAAGSAGGGIILDANGKPALGADGELNCPKPTPSGPVPAGRFVTIWNLKARDLPDTDLKGKGIPIVTRSRPFNVLSLPTPSLSSLRPWPDYESRWIQMETSWTPFSSSPCSMTPASRLMKRKPSTSSTCAIARGQRS